MYTSMLKNHVNGCHGNRAFFHGATEFILEDKIICMSWVPINDLEPTKNCLGGCKIGQISPQCTVHSIILCVQILL